jgi:GTPase SAR1 family protein
MGRSRKRNVKAAEYQLQVPLKIALCGEISSGKSSVIQALLREAFLPDFFGCEERPLIRIALGAPENAVTLLRDDGTTEALASLGEVRPDAGIVEIRVARTETQPFGPCEIVEVPPLRDGHLRACDIAEIAGCDVLVWTTIGSQAWRLSEKNILDELGERRPSQAVLVASRADKFRTDADRDRLLERLRRETAGYFGTCILLGASPSAIAGAANDRAAWERTGATAIAEALVRIAEEMPTDAVDAETTKPSANVIQLGTARPIPVEPSEAAAPRTVPEAAPEATPDPAPEAMPEPAALPNVSAALEPLMLLMPVETAPPDPLRAFLDTLNGVVAVGSVDLADGGNVEVIAGDEAAVRDFAQFCLGSARTLRSIAGFGDMDPSPEGEQVAMSHHQVIYRFEGERILFMASESAKQSTGIARTVFVRLVRIRAEGVVSRDAA